jgi:hypothetical protein
MKVEAHAEKQEKQSDPVPVLLLAEMGKVRDKHVSDEES